MNILRAFSCSIALCSLAQADNVLHPGTPDLDRPTLTALGVQLPISGDDNLNATVSLRYRKTGTTTWNNALPLFRVHPGTTLPYVIAPQFAGSVFDLSPATSYDLELHAVDPDGPVDQRFTLTATTRAVPADPATPRVRNVTDVNSLNQALGSAQPGDVITLANGNYSGQFALYTSGTEANPIVIRGASQSGVILDGGNCSGCNVFELYGSWIYLEQMTVQNAERAVKFQTAGGQGNVVRRVHTKNTILGITGKQNQLDFYIADNILEGRLTWPSIYTDDNGLHSSDDGINVQGFGHVVAHNRISGFGDAMKTSQDGARAVDFYGNEILWSYDNGVELDGAEGNARLFRNRFTNTYEAISGQPINGGPAYIVRNVCMNTVSEQLKLHSHGSPATEPNGVFAYHNTFISGGNALTLQTPTSVHHFAIENNIFIGPAQPFQQMTVDWYAYIDEGLFDYNGYWPNDYFAYNYKSGRLKVWGLAALQQANMEVHGTLLNPQTMAGGMIGPANYTVLLQPPDFALASGSPAIDRGLLLANINDAFKGSAPDLGALEAGCAEPIYGPRPVGADETNEPLGCTTTGGTPAKSIAAVSGTPQTAALETAFLPLQAKVLDAQSNPVPGIAVRFTAPASGASATFNGSASVVVNTDANGIAAATQAAANNTAGSYTVTAAAAGVAAPANFRLTNAIRTTTGLVVPATIPYSTNAQPVLLSATVSGGPIAIGSGSVVFRANGTLAGTVAVSNGAAALTLQVPGGTPRGTQGTFTAQYQPTLAALLGSTSSGQVVTIR